MGALNKKEAKSKRKYQTINDYYSKHIQNPNFHIFLSSNLNQIYWLLRSFITSKTKIITALKTKHTIEINTKLIVIQHFYNVWKDEDRIRSVYHFVFVLQGKRRKGKKKKKAQRTELI